MSLTCRPRRRTGPSCRSRGGPVEVAPCASA